MSISSQLSQPSLRRVTRIEMWSDGQARPAFPLNLPDRDTGLRFVADMLLDGFRLERCGATLRLHAPERLVVRRAA